MVIMDFESLYAKIMEIDASIRYAVVQNHTGEKIFGGFRKNINPILDDEELKMMHYYASQRWHTRKNIEHKLGKTRYAMAEYDKLKRITFPINEKYTILVTTETNSDHTNIIKKIFNLADGLTQ